MNTTPTTTLMAPGQIHALTPTRTAVLVVQQGTLWATQTDDPHDHVLRAGQSLPLQPGQRLVLEAAHGQPAHYTVVPSRSWPVLGAYVLWARLGAWLLRPAPLSPSQP